MQNNPSKFSFMQRWALIYAHPRKVILNLVVAMWIIYFLWNRSWQPAVFAFLASGMLGIISAWYADIEALSKTTIGKVALMHLEPLNFLVQSVGIIAIVYGLWNHGIDYIMVGISIMALTVVLSWKSLKI